MNCEDAMGAAPYEASEAQIIGAARESLRAVIDPDDYPLDPAACALAGPDDSTCEGP